MDLPNPLQGGDAVEPGHFYIENAEIESFGLSLRERLPTIGRRLDLASLVLEEFSQNEAEVFLIVRDQDSVRAGQTHDSKAP